MKVDPSVIKADVNVEIEVRDAVTGRLVRPVIRRHNLFVTKGLDVLADVLAGTGTYNGDGNVTHMGVGTGTTSPAAGDTALVAQVFRGALTKISRVSQSVACELYLTSVQGNGSTLTEAGLFNGDTGAASPNDAMFARVVHDEIAKTSSITVTYRWTINFSAVS